MSESAHDEKAVFLAALQQPVASERDAYLRGACAGDPELLNRVKALLAVHDESQGPLDVRAPGIGLERTTDLPAGEGPGTVIGPYKLLEQIGEGGFGLVFMAEQQQPLRRKVAVKIIKPGMDSRQVIARFEAERQALALMDHPNIARVLDAGATGGGRPYFVMELVRGQPITDYCDEHKLTPRARLELFGSVCQAVLHAHQKGIIHRDIKPSNVLVTLHDGVPVVKVIDFGVAKALGQQLTDKTLFTGYAQLVGTPLYMSPEQAELSGLDIDTRSDIYSLGVLLYELLTGVTPFDKKRLRDVGYEEMRRIIREEEPAKPSTRMSTLGQAAMTVSERRQSDPKRLSRLFRGELDWIVMKALEKDRNRRYETASAFAADVERYLADEAVLACPPSAWYRFRKFARRNKRGLATTSLVLLVLVGGIVGTTLGMIQADRARNREAERAEGERQAGEREAEQRIKAEKARDRTYQALNATISSLVGDKLSRQKAISNDQKQFLSEFLGYYQEFAGEKADDEQSRARTALAANWVGVIEYYLGRMTEASAACRQACDGYERIAADFPTVPEYRERLAICRRNLGAVFADLGKRTEAEEQDRHALAIMEELAKDFPDRPQYRRDVAGCRVGLGMLLANLGKWEEAEKQDRQGLAIQETLAKDFPAIDDYRHELAHGYNTLAILLTHLGKRPEAEERYRQALALQEKLAADFPTVPRIHQFLARYHNNLGLLLADLGKWPEVEQQYRQALAILEKLADNFLGVPEYRQELANSYLNLGNLLMNMGKRPQAEQQYRQALDIHLKLARDFPAVPQYRHELNARHINLGLVLSGLGKQREAEQELRQAVAIEKRLTVEFPTMPEYRLYLARGHNHLATVLAAQLKWPLAEEQYHLALAILEKLTAEFPAVPEYQINLGGGYCNLGILIRDNGLPNDSLVWFEKAIRTLSSLYEHDRQLRPASQFLRNSHWSRAVAYGLLQKHAAAVEDWNKAIELSPQQEQPMYRAERAISRINAGQMAEAAAEVAELAKKPNQPNTLQAMTRLAMAYQAAGKLDPALRLFEDTLKWRKTNLPADHPDTLTSMNNLALAYQDAGKLELALPLYEETLKRRKAILPSDHPDLLLSMNNLAWGYLGAGKLDLALPLYEETLGRMKSKPGLEHPNTLRVMNNLGNGYLRAGQTAKAESLLRECLAIRERTEPGGWRTFDAKSMLGAALLGQKRYKDSEPLLLAGYQGLNEHEASIPPSLKLRMIEALERLVQFYIATGNPEKTKEWQKKLAEAKDKHDMPRR